MNVFWKQSFKIIVHTDQDTFLVHCEGIVAGQTNVSTFVSKISFLSCVGSEIKFPLSTAPASFSQTQCTVTFFFFFLSWVKSQRLSLVLHVHLLQLSLIRSFSSFFFISWPSSQSPRPLLHRSHLWNIDAGQMTSDSFRNYTAKPLSLPLLFFSLFSPSCIFTLPPCFIYDGCWAQIFWHHSSLPVFFMCLLCLAVYTIWMLHWSRKQNSIVSESLHFFTCLSLCAFLLLS